VFAIHLAGRVVPTADSISVWKIQAMPGGAHDHMRGWSPEEDSLLLEMINTTGKKWKFISEQLQMYERTPAMVRNRYLRITRGRWLTEQGQSKNRCGYCHQLKRGHVCPKRPSAMEVTEAGFIPVAGFQLQLNPLASSVQAEMLPMPPAVVSRTDSMELLARLAGEQRAITCDPMGTSRTSSTSNATSDTEATMSCDSTDLADVTGKKTHIIRSGKAVMLTSCHAEEGTAPRSSETKLVSLKSENSAYTVHDGQKVC